MLGFALCVAFGGSRLALADDGPGEIAFRLAGLAVLPPDTFADGPTSGQLIEAREVNGRRPPFDGQPVQGVSSLIPAGEPGVYFALSDNGFGRKANSADYLLRVYRVTPAFKTAEGGAGTVAWEVAFTLSDPDRHVPWPIVADGAAYPGSDVPVPAEVRERRLLTGADFDVESFVRLDDGTFWVGDEFGPFLLHVDAAGRLLGPPVDLVGVPGADFQSPDHPRPSPTAIELPGSAGFEGMAIDGRGKGAVLRPMLEKNGRVFAFAPSVAVDAVWTDADSRFAGAGFVRYPLERGHSIGEFVSLGKTTLVIERDGRQGDKAVEKAIYLWSGRARDARKVRLADLLNVPDPHDLDGDGSDTFRFPFLTIESVWPIDDRTLLVVNDNNYPFTAGRTPGRPDATEFILLRFDKPIASFAAP